MQTSSVEAHGTWPGVSAKGKQRTMHWPTGVPEIDNLPEQSDSSRCAFEAPTPTQHDVSFPETQTKY